MLKLEWISSHARLACQSGYGYVLDRSAIVLDSSSLPDILNDSTHPKHEHYLLNTIIRTLLLKYALQLEFTCMPPARDGFYAIRDIAALSVPLS